MKLATVEVAGKTTVTVVDADGWRVAAAEGATLGDVVRRGLPVDLRQGELLSDPPRILAPLTPRQIIAVGLNYMDHIRESGMETPKQPLLFAKLPSSVIGTDQPVALNSALTTRVDWEVELAVVIGREARDVNAKEALACVFGYTIANDVSARDIQFSDGQWTRAKSLDGFCPLGPCVVTADEVSDPQNLHLSTRVNGETMQDASTKEMIFGVRELISFCSRSFTLQPGDVILTGTPWGVGEFMKPQRCLKPGDVVECKIDAIGVLRNPIVAA